MNWIEDMGPDLVIIPDAGSNDVEYLEILEKQGTGVIILDHHEIEEQDWWRTIDHPRLFLINSQSPQYPNKELSGAGVVWQFCRYLDKFWNNSYANQYLDLAALGLIGDMMSLKSFETRRIITKGINPNCIINPFIYEMWQKNKFKLTDTPTAWGFTFYIVPFVNAITRSGTLEEKELIFS
jgi:single-stranded-DNA-specific exonuclease